MKICGIVAEYNPLHFGHISQLNYVKEELGAEKVVVIMSGNFTQRGEFAVRDKFTRAKWAIQAGADMVIELPAVFSIANAEVFAKGAIKILNGLGCIDGICFGVESGQKADYLALARAMNDESKEFKRALKEKLSDGVSLAKAKFEALKSLGRSDLDEKLISSPNNILGLEYTKAILSEKSNMDIYPLLREGDHTDATLKKGVTSALSIRTALESGAVKKVKKSVPKFVYPDLTPLSPFREKVLLSALIRASAADLEKLPDCTEGLENRIKALLVGNKTLDALIEKTATKRYPRTRIKRIIACNLLGITGDLVKDCINCDLYAKVLAVKGESKSLMSEIAKTCKIPFLTRKTDCENLKKTAAKCYEKDILAAELYELISNEKQNPNQMLTV